MNTIYHFIQTLWYSNDFIIAEKMMNRFVEKQIAFQHQIEIKVSLYDVRDS